MSAAVEAGIVIDGRLYERTHFGGAVRFLTGLADGLASLSPTAVLIHGSPKPPHQHLPTRAALWSTCPGGCRVWITDHPQRLCHVEADRKVLVVHDTMGWSATERVPDESRVGAMWEDFVAACHSANLVVTVSQATRGRLLGLVPDLDADRVRVVPHALSLPRLRLCRSTDREGVVLHVGGRAGYKHFDHLIRAFGDAFPEPSPARLVTVGGRAALDPHEAALVERCGITSRVASLGYVTDDELACWYRRARVVAIPSTCEGFGLPYLEAVSARTPLVAADLPVVREVVGASFEAFRPGDVTGLAAAVRRAWAREGVGPALTGCRASWTWADSAELLLEALRQNHTELETVP